MCKQAKKTVIDFLSVHAQIPLSVQPHVLSAFSSRRKGLNWRDALLRELRSTAARSLEHTQTHTDTTKDKVEAHTHTAFQFRWVTVAHRGNNSVADLPCDATHTFTEETQLTTLSSTVTEKVIEDKIESKWRESWDLPSDIITDWEGKLTEGQWRRAKETWNKCSDV